MRILFIGEGRLGNQVFQYAALCSVARAGARITAIGLEELESVFELRGPTIQVLRGYWLKRVAIYILAPWLLRPLARWLRLFSYACELQQGGAHRGSSGQLHVQRGLLGGVLFVDGGYYQSSEFWGDLFPPRWLSLRESWRARARAILLERAGRQPLKPYFLHLRRGDYHSFSIYGVGDLLLPTDYFRRAIEQFQARGDFDLLALVTDDPAWARSEFGAIPGSVVIGEDPCTDFALMAECAGGIISNSTFSLSAAMFMRNPDRIIAPEYWFGFRVGRWLPPRIRFEHPRIDYLPVLPAAAA